MHMCVSVTLGFVTYVYIHTNIRHLYIVHLHIHTQIMQISVCMHVCVCNTWVCYKHTYVFSNTNILLYIHIQIMQISVRICVCIRMCVSVTCIVIYVCIHTNINLYILTHTDCANKCVYMAIYACICQ